MTDYSSIINDAASVNGIPPEVLSKIINVESSGNPNAVSPKGATGLGQLMPGTAKEMGVTDSTDPVQNINGTAKYYKQQYDRYGNHPQALAAYNAGPNRDAVVNGDWGKLPTETKKYVNGFQSVLNKIGNSVIKPASADETPYVSTTITATQKEPEVNFDDAKNWKVVNDSTQSEVNFDDAKNWKVVNGSSSVPEKTSQSSVPEALMLGGIDGTTFGFGKKAGAGVMALTQRLMHPEEHKDETLGQTYNNMNDVWSQRDKTSSNEHPVAYTGANIAGMIASPLNRIGSGFGIVKQFAVSGGLMGAGRTEKIEDLPTNVALGAGIGAAGGKVLGTASIALKDFYNNALVHTTGDVADKAATQLMNTVGGGIAADTRQGTIAQSEQNIKNAYTNLDNLSKNSTTVITPTKSYDAIKAVDDLDSTALNELNKNKTTASAIDKIRNGQYLDALESSTLHKHLTRISGVDGETGYALKQAQKALGEDITASGNPALTDSLNTASSTYAKGKSIESLNKLVEKHTVQTETGPEINYATLNTGLKNWSLSKEGVKAIKFTPGLKTDIVNLQELIHSHPELKSLSKNPNDATSFANLVKKAIGPSLGRHIGLGLGAIVGGPVGGPVGALVGAAVGEGVQRAGAAGATNLLKSKIYEPTFRKALQAKVTPTVP